MKCTAYFLLLVYFKVITKVCTGKVANNITVNDARTASWARNACRSVQSTLPVNLSEVQEIIPSSGPLWLNLQRVVLESWRVDYNSGSSLREYNIPGNGNCAYLGADGLQASDCFTNGLGFVCSQEMCSKCKTTDCYEYGHRCLTRFCGARNWYDARQKCRSYSSQLATWITKNMVIKDLWLSTSGTCKDVWLGIHREDWFMVTPNGYEPIRSYNWGPVDWFRVRNGTCAVADGKHGYIWWSPASCTDRYNYFCQPSINLKQYQKTKKPLLGNEFGPNTTQPTDKPGSDSAMSIIIIVTVPSSVLIILLINLCLCLLIRKHKYSTKINSSEARDISESSVAPSRPQSLGYRLSHMYDDLQADQVTAPEVPCRPARENRTSIITNRNSNEILDYENFNKTEGYETPIQSEGKIFYKEDLKTPAETVHLSVITI